MGILAILALLFMSPVAAWAATFSVNDYGAVGNGITDDSQAFLKAWRDACGDTGRGATTFAIPSRNYFLNPINFTGPCKPANIIVQISGALLAPMDQAIWKNRANRWIMFNDVNGLIVKGTGTINGRGQNWWIHPCKQTPNSTCIFAPTQLSFSGCNNLRMSDLKLINGPRNHISISDCSDVLLSQLTITAPYNSSNTDGIDIANSNNVRIQSSTISTGDDCIAINSGTKNVNITLVDCGPGHGISIGSLGGKNSTGTVEQIHVRQCNFTRTTNGARIKTWQGGSGFARAITFEDINLVSVQNPIIIDQFYCPNGVCAPQVSAVQVSDVKYKGIRGTSSGTSSTIVAIALNCSRTIPCTGIVMEDIQITSDDPKKQVSSNCINVRGTGCPTCTPKVICTANLLSSVEPDSNVISSS